MKKFILSITCLLMISGVSFAQNSINLYSDGSQSITSANVNPTSTFSLDTYVTFSGFTGRGLSYWLQVPNALASFITITGESYVTWTDDNQTFFGSDVFNQTSGTAPGFMNADRDLGATSVFSSGTFQQDKAAGTYQVSNLDFALNNAPAGTYEIRLTTLSPKQSEISDSASVAHNVGTAAYTIRVVPEPATWALLGFGGLGSMGLTWLRARRRR